jgi:hypothetical protein
VVKFISKKSADKVIVENHYSKKSLVNSQLHLGVFYMGKLEGAMQFGPPIDRYKLIGIVEGTKFYDFLELNRMAFSEELPKNSESRAISIALKMIKKNYPSIKWIVSFADGTQCGDGTIYRASGFCLTQIKKNSTISRTENGKIIAKHESKKIKEKATPLKGYQFRYIYFLDKSWENKLTVDKIPFSKIKELGISIYKGKFADEAFN